MWSKTGHGWNITDLLCIVYKPAYSYVHRKSYIYTSLAHKAYFITYNDNTHSLMQWNVCHRKDQIWSAAQFIIVKVISMSTYNGDQMAVMVPVLN